MHFDFAAFLVLATLISGVIWGVDALFWAPGRRRLAASRRAAGQESDEIQVAMAAKEPVIVEYARSFFPVFLIVLLLRSFVVEPFRIPSGSMMPTLLNGDFILVNKFSYGIRLPVLESKVVNVDRPERGDVVVFRYPREPSIDYIKRVVGVPGDHIAYRDKMLYINGERINQEVLGRFSGSGTAAVMTGAGLRNEQLGEVVHEILVMDGKPDRGFEFVVPENQYFVMGDNRDNSNDSRYWGTVPDENLVGKAFMIWMNWDSAKSSVLWRRIGTLIK